MHTLFYVQDIYAVCVCKQLCGATCDGVDAAAIKKATALNSPWVRIITNELTAASKFLNFNYVNMILKKNYA